MTATDNLPTTGGTDSATPSTDLDNPANWDYFDPDEEKQDTEAPKEATGTAVEKAEDEPQGETVQEATDEQQEHPADEAEEKPTERKAEPSVSDDVEVTLKSGEKVTLRELRDGYMRQSDFTRKRQADAQRASHIQSVSDRIQNFLASQIPPMPAPQLAYADPNAYAAQLAQHDAAKRQWQEVANVNNEAKQAEGSFSEEERSEHLQAEFTRLVDRIPSMATTKGKDEFINRVKPALEYAGVSLDELNSFTEHRYFLVLDLAADGLAARKAKESAKIKAAQAPPVAAPNRQVTQKPAAVKNQDAMKKLARSGSIYDAMNVEFE